MVDLLLFSELWCEMIYAQIKFACHFKRRTSVCVQKFTDEIRAAPLFADTSRTDLAATVFTNTFEDIIDD